MHKQKSAVYCDFSQTRLYCVQRYLYSWYSVWLIGIWNDIKLAARERNKIRKMGDTTQLHDVFHLIRSVVIINYHNLIVGNVTVWIDPSVSILITHRDSLFIFIFSFLCAVFLFVHFGRIGFASVHMLNILTTETNDFFFFSILTHIQSSPCNLKFRTANVVNKILFFRQMINR